MEIKVKHILLILIGIIISFILFCLLIAKKKPVNYGEVNTTESYTIEKRDITDFGILNGELFSRLTAKNGNWDGIPLSDNFKNKFNSEDGILGNLIYDKCEYCPDLGENHPLSKYEYFVLTDGKKKTAYLYDYNNIGTDVGTRIDDFFITEEIPLTDEDGISIDYRIPIKNNNFFQTFLWLSSGDEDEKLVAVTDHFHKKYPYFFDLFIHYSPFYYNKIKFLPDRSNYEKKEAFFEVDSILECKKRQYKVKFTLDEKNYLDDADVELINTVEYEGSNKDRTWKVFYQNSNWDNLKITDHYREKFKEKSYNEDIEKIDVDNEDPDAETHIYDDNHKFLRTYTFTDGNTYSYYVEYIYDDNKYLDDVICEKLPYVNMSIEEVKEAYLRDNPQE